MSIRTFIFLALTGATFLFMAEPVWGQALPIAEASRATVVDQDSPAGPKTTPPAQKDKVEIDPLFSIGVAQGGKYVPLTKGERWELYWKSTFFSPGAFFGVVFPAAIDQAGSVPPEWGGGMQGYGKRVASRFGQNLINNTIQHGGAALRSRG